MVVILLVSNVKEFFFFLAEEHLASEKTVLYGSRLKQKQNYSIITPMCSGWCNN